MNNIERKSVVADLILELEKSLREHGVWSDHSPSVEAMMSVEPFSCDTMDLTQWLQWIFIPKMKALIESDASLPSNSNIAAYAEEAFKGESTHCTGVIPVIRRLDEAMV